MYVQEKRKKIVITQKKLSMCYAFGHKKKRREKKKKFFSFSFSFFLFCKGNLGIA